MIGNRVESDAELASDTGGIAGSKHMVALEMTLRLR
jgi:hypothetical protein